MKAILLSMLLLSGVAQANSVSSKFTISLTIEPRCEVQGAGIQPLCNGGQFKFEEVSVMKSEIVSLNNTTEDSKVLVQIIYY